MGAERRAGGALVGDNVVGELTTGRPSLPSLVAALLAPGAYSHPADRIELHETHISWIVLVGAFGYKIKKPVNLGFVDFTTLERRAVDCADEVRLNRRLCPDTYLGVVDIVERDGAHFIGGPGRPVEPAVWMRRLPADGMLPALLARNAVEPDQVRRIAVRLAEFHERVTTGPGVDEYGTLTAVRENWQENFDQTAAFIGRTLASPVRARIIEFVELFMSQHRELFDRRVAAGRVRDGHGDLHAGSVCLEGERVLLFDCLEFSPRYRCSDVAAEVAFLAMDLDYYDRADLSAAFVDEYVRRSGDDELRGVLDFYKCYRAYVRGKVSSLRLEAPGRAPGDGPAIQAEARAYFDLASGYAGGGGPSRS